MIFRYSWNKKSQSQFDSVAKETYDRIKLTLKETQFQSCQMWKKSSSNQKSKEMEKGKTASAINLIAKEVISL